MKTIFKLGCLLPVCLLLIFMVYICSGPKESKVATSSSTDVFVQPEAKIESKSIKYEEVDSWSTNGSVLDPKRVFLLTIAPSNANDSDLVELCSELLKDKKKYSFASVKVYTSEKAALMSKSILNNENESQLEYYDENFVLSYLKNNSTGMHECAVFPMRKHPKTIKF